MFHSEFARGFVHFGFFLRALITQLISPGAHVSLLLMSLLTYFLRMKHFIDTPYARINPLTLSWNSSFVHESGILTSHRKPHSYIL